MGLSFKKEHNYSCEDRETVVFTMKGIRVALSLQGQQMLLDLEKATALQTE